MNATRAETVGFILASLLFVSGCTTTFPLSRPGHAFNKPSNPVPRNGATGVSPDTTLSWSYSSNAASFRIYFGTESPPPFRRRQTRTVFDPGPLDFDTTYYWRIDPVGGPKGDLWKFTTFWYGDPNAEEMDI